MKKKTGFQVRDIAGEKVLVAYGLENIDFSKMVSLNETACFIWELIEPGDTVLVKASRGMHLEEVVRALEAAEA